MSYTPEQLKLMRLAGIRTGYQIDEMPSYPEAPSIYGEPREITTPQRLDRAAHTSDNFDFDDEINAIVGEPQPDESATIQPGAVMPSIDKLAAFITAAAATMSAEEKKQVILALDAITEQLCD